MHACSGVVKKKKPDRRPRSRCPRRYTDTVLGRRMPPQRHAATYRGSDRGRPAGAPCAPMLGYSCCRRPRLRARRGNRQTAQAIALARTQNHTHASMHARAPAAGGVRSGRAAECRLPIPVQRAAGARATTTRARRETPTPSGSIATKTKKKNARSWGHVKAYACAAGAACARWTERGTEGPNPKRPNPPRKTYERGRRRGRPCCWGRR